MALFPSNPQVSLPDIFPPLFVRTTRAPHTVTKKTRQVSMVTPLHAACAQIQVFSGEVVLAGQTSILFTSWYSVDNTMKPLNSRQNRFLFQILTQMYITYMYLYQLQYMAEDSETVC